MSEKVGRNIVSSKYIVSDDIKSLEGFVWGEKTVKASAGVSMWTKPLWIKQKSQKIALILLDSEGLFDEEVPAKYRAAIIAFITVISSLLIYNVQSNIHEIILASFVEHLETSLQLFQKQENKACQRLVFLVRDWIGGKKYVYGESDGKLYIRKILEDIKSTSDLEMQRRRYLEDNFGKVDCFLMPHPGDTVADLENENDQTDSPHLLNMKAKFVKAFKELVPFICLPLWPAADKDGDNILTGDKWLKSFLTHAAVFSEGKTLENNSACKVQIEKHNRKLVNEMLDRFQDEMKKSEPYNGSEMEEIREKIIARFTKRASGEMEEQKRFCKILSEKMNDRLRLAVIDSELKEASAKAAEKQTCEMALKDAKLRFLSSLEESSSQTDVVAARSSLRQAKKDAMDFYDKHAKGTSEVRKIYGLELCNLMAKKEEMINREFTLQKQALRESEMKVKYAVTTAVKEYRNLQMQKYGHTKSPVPREILSKDHTEWLEVAKEAFLRETFRCQGQHKNHLTEIEEKCKSMYDGLVDHHLFLAKQCEEKRQNSIQETRSRVLEKYRHLLLEAQTHVDPLPKPEEVIDQLIRYFCKQSMSSTSFDIEKELRHTCLPEMLQMYQKQEHAETDFEVSLKTYTDTYTSDMVQEVFLKFNELTEAHDKVYADIYGEAVNEFGDKSGKFVRWLDHKIRPQFEEVKKLQGIFEEALEHFRSICKSERCQPGSVREEKAMERAKAKLNPYLLSSPLSGYKNWCMRGFKKACLTSSQQIQGHRTKSGLISRLFRS